jgi:hypothetical protein
MHRASVSIESRGYRTRAWPDAADSHRTCAHIDSNATSHDVGRDDACAGAPGGLWNDDAAFSTAAAAGGSTNNERSLMSAAAGESPDDAPLGGRLFSVSTTQFPSKTNRHVGGPPARALGDPHGDRVHPPGRAHHGHLLPPAQGAHHHVSRHCYRGAWVGVGTAGRQGRRLVWSHESTLFIPNRHCTHTPLFPTFLPPAKTTYTPT